MKKIKAVAAAAASCFLSACATGYFVDNVKYDDKEQAIRAVDQKHSLLSRNIKPLPSPIVGKTLVVVCPTKQMTDRILTGVAKRREPFPLLSDRTDFTAYSSYKECLGIAEAVRMRSVYLDVQLIETEESPGFIPSEKIDYLYKYINLNHGAAAYYLDSARTGKTFIAADPSKDEYSEQISSFVDQLIFAAAR